MRYDPRQIPPSADPTIREGFRTLTDIVLRWDVRLSVCAIITAGVALALTGCASSGAAHLIATSDPSSGYEMGIGVRAEIEGRGSIAPVAQAKLTNARKFDADSGYTYAASAGVRFGSRWYAEPGWIAYGYESNFPDGSTWRKRSDSWYAATGYRADDWAISVRYVPSPGDSYDSDELSIKSQFSTGRLSLFVEPSMFRLASYGKTETHTAVQAGVGVRW